MRMTYILFTLCVVSAALEAPQPASAVVIGSWDLARGGIDSLADDPSQAGLRSFIQSVVPTATFSSTNVLTPEYLSTVGVVFVGAATSTTTVTTPLSAAEQTALLNFVLAGGNAFIGTDNLSMVDSSATYSSMLSPFGLASTGDLTLPDSATVVNTTHPITNGSFGLVTDFPTNRVGWYSSLGPYATPLATFDGNDQPILAVIDRGMMSSTSGAVLFLSDVNVPEFAFINDNSLRLLSNTLEFLVPEPSSLLLASLGGLLMSLTLLRRRRS